MCGIARSSGWSRHNIDGREIRLKSCARVKFKSTSDITLFTVETTKIFFKTK